MNTVDSRHSIHYQDKSMILPKSESENTKERSLKEILEEKIERRNELKHLLIDTISQEEYKSMLDHMFRPNNTEERILSRRYFLNEDGDLIKEIRTSEGVRVINLSDPFAFF